MTAKTSRRLLDYLHHRQGDMTDLLEQLVQAESPSTVPAAQQNVLAILQTALGRRNYRVRRIPGRQTGGHLLAAPSDRTRQQPTQLLLGHCDTVWPIGALDTMPLLMRQGKMYGPGVYDMKAGLVMIIFAVEAALASDLKIDVAPVIFINSDTDHL